MSSYLSLLHLRQISTTASCLGKKNFRKFLVPNKRGTRVEKANRGKPGGLPIDHRGVRPTGYYVGEKFVPVPEMIPELIVPDLTDCELKPYVSYRAPKVTQTEFTSQDLFNAIYAQKIIKDMQEDKLKENGDPVDPSLEEQMTPDQAIMKARKTGSDFI